MIISGSATQSLAAQLAQELDEPLAPVEYDRFPDGELYVRLGQTDADRAVIVASTVSPAAHIEVLQLQDAAREAGIDEVVTVIPYMGYARQDKAFKSGEPVSARAIARGLSPGTDRVITVSPHEDTVCSFFDPPATAVDGAGRLAPALPDDLQEPVFLAPDKGATGIARTVQSAYGTGTVDAVEKVRHSGTEVAITDADLSVTGRDVVVVDDIVATGSTMSEVVKLLADHDTRRVFVACVHPLFARNARTKLARAGVTAIYGTDTIERPVSTVSVAPAIAREL